MTEAKPERQILKIEKQIELFGSRVGGAQRCGPRV